MRSRRAPFTRPAVALAMLAGLLVVAAGCRPRSHEFEPGSYRAIIELPGGELPFALDVAREQSGFVLHLVNGGERVRIPAVVTDAGRLTARMPGGGNTLTAKISGGDLEGEFTVVRAGGAKQALPFRAELGKTWLFFETPSTDNADFAGRWSFTFTDDQGRTSPGGAEFAQKFETVTGTILLPRDDRRYLAGEAHGDALYLSRFDGGEAHLFRAKLNERGELVGEHWSGPSGHERFVARRNPDAGLGMSPEATGLEDPAGNATLGTSP